MHKLGIISLIVYVITITTLRVIKAIISNTVDPCVLDVTTPNMCIGPMRI